MRNRRAWRNGPVTWLWGVLSATGTAPHFRPGMPSLEEDVAAYQRSIDEAISQGMVFAKAAES